MERKAVQGSLNCMQGTYMIVCTPLSTLLYLGPRSEEISLTQ